MTDIDNTLAERGNRYGDFAGHANVTQRLKRVIWEELHARDKELPYDMLEALDMIAHKIGRIINGDHNYDDSWVDIAGYAKLVANRLQSPPNVEPTPDPNASWAANPRPPIDMQALAETVSPLASQRVSDFLAARAAPAKLDEPSSSEG